MKINFLKLIILAGLTAFGFFLCKTGVVMATLKDFLFLFAGSWMVAIGIVYSLATLDEMLEDLYD